MVYSDSSTSRSSKPGVGKPLTAAELEAQWQKEEEDRLKVEKRKEDEKVKEEQKKEAEEEKKRQQEEAERLVILSF